MLWVKKGETATLCFLLTGSRCSTAVHGRHFSHAFAPCRFRVVSRSQVARNQTVRPLNDSHQGQLPRFHFDQPENKKVVYSWGAAVRMMHDYDYFVFNYPVGNGVKCLTDKFHLCVRKPWKLLMCLQMWLHVSFTAAQTTNGKNIWGRPDQTLLEDSDGRQGGFKAQQHLKSTHCSGLHKGSPASTVTWNPGQCRGKGGQQGALNTRPAEFWRSPWFFIVPRH